MTRRKVHGVICPECQRATETSDVTAQTPSPSTTVAPSVIYCRGGSSKMSRRHHPLVGGLTASDVQHYSVTVTKTC